jgi:hypothetical protein
LSEDFTLYRGEGGKPQVVEFRCPQKPMAVKRGRRRTVGAACRSQRSAPNLRRQTEMRRPAYAAP